MRAALAVKASEMALDGLNPGADDFSRQGPPRLARDFGSDVSGNLSIGPTDEAMDEERKRQMPHQSR